MPETPKSPPERPERDAAPPASAPPGAAPPDAGKQPAHGELRRLGDLAEKHTARRHAEIQGMLEIMASKRRLFWINFLAGLSRGIGFFLGVTLVGGMLIGSLAIAFDFTASTLGWKELRFSSLVASLAEKYREAERVWTAVEEAEDEDPTDAAEALTPPAEDEPLEPPAERR